MSRVELEGIFEEVDQQLEAENVARMWLKNRYWIIGGLVCLFLGLFAYVGWSEYQKKRDLEVADRYLGAMEVRIDDDAAGRKALNAVTADYGQHGYALMARFAEARALAEEGKRDEAVRLLEEVSATAGVPLKDLATLQAAYVLADDPKRALQRLEGMARESAYKPHALEFAGILTSGSGDDKGALALYKDALSLKPEGGLRKRLERRIQRMGG
ncbi:MAG: tetratricopeptide repeat protein [Magnetococcales bacterium]|nr:tetratricopeptide repeat protein [Magnetococcales bacterium]